MALGVLGAMAAAPSNAAPATCPAGTIPAAIMGSMAGFGIDGNLQAGDGFGNDWFGISGGDVGGVIGRSSCSPIPAGSLDTFFGGPTTGFDGNWAGAGIDRVFGPTSNKDEDCIGPGVVSGNWSFKCGNGPQKDDITEVYLTRRKSATGHTILILGVADRSINGDKNLGVVFFRNGIHAEGTACAGKLVGHGVNCGHTNNDRFFAIEFSNGGSKACFIERKWVNNHYETVTPVQGSDPLVIAAVNQAATAAPCGAVATGSSGAIVNSYEAKQFSEIAFDLTALGVPNEELCGPDFDIMIQTRSSTELSAELKDFVIVPFSPLPSPQASVAELEICAGSSAQLCANATSGQAPYKYLWNTGETSECITTSIAGAYSVTVTDANGCSGSDAGSVVVNPKPTAAVPSPEVCAGSSAELCANAASGTPPYKYLWSNGATSACITVSQAGPYSVTVTDAKGCQVTSQGALVVNPKPTAAVPSPEICAGSSTQLCANAASGTAPYKYLWSTGETSACITASVAGPYSVTVTDAKGCQVTSQGALVVNPRPSAAVPSLEICAGRSTQLCANAASGTPPYKYLWSNGATSECISVSQAGPYSVTVTDAKGCQVTSQGALAVNPRPTAAVPTLDVCAGGSAQLCANAASGTAPYQYAWSTGETSACITVSAAGPYSVTVTDAKGCQVTSNGALVVNPQPTAAVPNLEICAGSSTQLCANAASGTAPYKYLWSNGATSACITVSQAGPYSVTVTDAKGCQVTSAGSLAVNPAPTAAVPDGQACATSPIQICANPLGGTPPYSFSWNTGATTECISVTKGGTYRVTVRDAKGCVVVDAGDVQENCAEGCTPGFWCGGVGSTLWNTASDPDWKAIGGLGTNPFKLNSKFESFFAASAAIADNKTMSDLLCNGAGPVPAEKAARAVIAAYLNASFGLDFPFTAAQVAAKWAAAVGSNTALNALAGELLAADEANCPIGRGAALVGNDGELQMQSPGLTEGIALYRPTPNPFTGATRFAFLVPDGSGERVSIGVYDLLGRRIRGLANGVMPAGRHEVSWDGRDEGGNLVKGGLYFVSSSVGKERRTLHVLFLK